MKIQVFALSIILISGTECVLKRQSCKDLDTKKQCNNTDDKGLQCYWNNTCLNNEYQSCYLFLTESECQESNEYLCYWQNGQCMKKTNQTENQICENIDNYIDCSYTERRQEQFCTWKHGRCYTIQKCSEITDFKQCRNAYMRERCQYVINNVASSQEKEYMYIADIFDYNSCRSEDCLFKTYTSCPEFVNGRRCFLNSGQCTQCSYQTNPNDCIATKQCTWQSSECSNIICFQITSKRLCNQINYCQYDFTIQSCQIKNKDKNSSHCYNYNISSDPINTKYNSFFGL